MSAIANAGEYHKSGAKDGRSMRAEQARLFRRVQVGQRIAEGKWGTTKGNGANAKNSTNEGIPKAKEENGGCLRARAKASPTQAAIVRWAAIQFAMPRSLQGKAPEHDLQRQIQTNTRLIANWGREIQPTYAEDGSTKLEQDVIN